MATAKVECTQAGKPKTNFERGMLYEACPICQGKGMLKCDYIGDHHGDKCHEGRIQSPNAQFTRTCPKCKGGIVVCHLCKPLHVVETGLTEPQTRSMAELETLRQEAGISAAMLRDGRAAAFRDMLVALKNLVADWSECERVGCFVPDEINEDSHWEAARAAIAKAEGLTK